MHADRFQRLMRAARALPSGDYARGVVRGLRRAHHGERFGTEEEHAAWLAFDGHRAELARGYRDGLAGRVPGVVDDTDSPLRELATTLSHDAYVESDGSYHGLQRWGEQTPLVREAIARSGPELDLVSWDTTSEDERSHRFLVRELDSDRHRFVIVDADELRARLGLDATVSPEALRAIIEASGLSQVEWARTVAGRDPRTVRRWLAGEAIPPTTAEWIARLVRVETRAGDVVITVAR